MHAAWVVFALAAALSGCGAKEKCLEGCAQAEQSQKHACAGQTGAAKTMCEGQIQQALDTCKMACENARGVKIRF